jgi:hypothetical protein
MKNVAVIVSAILLLASGVLAARFASAEDTWVCEEGIWIPHGVPDQPMPEERCR